MSKEELKEYLPDSAEEFSFIGTAIVSLGTGLSGYFTAIGQDNWTLATLVVTWLGHTIEKYFQIYQKKKKDETI